MAGKNSADRAFERDNFLLSMIGFDGGCSYEADVSLSDYDEGIFEAQCLLDDAIRREDKDEISNLRRDIQRMKVAKRRLREKKISQEVCALA